MAVFKLGSPEMFASQGKDGALVYAMAWTKDCTSTCCTQSRDTV